MGQLIKDTSACSGRDTDKFSKFNIETLESKYIRPPLIKDAVACFECKVRGKLDTGDHTLFVGESLASYISEKYQDRLYNFGRRRFKSIANKFE